MRSFPRTRRGWYWCIDVGSFARINKVEEDKFQSNHKQDKGRLPAAGEGALLVVVEEMGAADTELLEGELPPLSLQVGCDFNDDFQAGQRTHRLQSQDELHWLRGRSS